MKKQPHFLTLSFVFLWRISFLSLFPNLNYLNLKLKIILVKKKKKNQAKFFVSDYFNNATFFKHHHISKFWKPND